MLTLFQRMSNSGIDFQGDLAFVNHWDFFMPDPSSRLENLVPVGPYAGTLGAFKTGVTLRTRYEHLHAQALERRQTNLWASGSDRVAETARYFATGFYGTDWQDTAHLHVIPETADRGANTLTPGDTCTAYSNRSNPDGHDNGFHKQDEFKDTYLPAIAERLNMQNPGINFTESEVLTMQEICGFEILAKGSSSWCDVFTHDEWLAFEYARDLLHFYRSGPGNKYGPTMGWLLLNATMNLLTAGPDAVGPLFFSL